MLISIDLYCRVCSTHSVVSHKRLRECPVCNRHVERALRNAKQKARRRHLRALNEAKRTASEERKALGIDGPCWRCGPIQEAGCGRECAACAADSAAVARLLSA